MQQEVILTVRISVDSSLQGSLQVDESAIREAIHFRPRGEDGEVLFKRACLESGLSEREIEVARGFMRGNSNLEISEELFISVNTVKYHSHKLFEKLGVRSRVQAVNRLSAAMSSFRIS